MTWKRLVTVLAVLALAGTPLLFAEGEGEGAAAGETPTVWFYGHRTVYGDFEPEDIPEATQWVEENFGFRVRITAFPEGMSTDEGLQLLRAQDQFPNVITGWRGGLSFFTLSDLAKAGQLLELDKYFEDPTRWPVYAGADQTYLAKYRVDGKLMGLPGRGWVLGDAVSHNQIWFQRLDVREEYGEPTTSDGVLDIMRAVKARPDDFLDLEGNAPSGFVMWVRDWAYRETIWSLKGAGWEVDHEHRLMPHWASEEERDSFRYLNTLWREGLMEPSQFLTDVGGLYGKLKTVSILYGTGGSHLGSLNFDTLDNLRREHGMDSAIWKQAHDTQHISVAPPIMDKPGRITNIQPDPTMISKDTPVPDQVMDYLHWALTDEGVVSAYLQAGIAGVHYDFVEAPEIWRLRPEFVGYNTQNAHSDDRPNAISATTCFRRNLDAGACKPIIAPSLINFSLPAYASFNHLSYIGAEDRRANGHVTRYLDADYLAGLAAATGSIPSYAQVTESAPPLEASALASAEERFNNAVVPLITAESPEAFEAAYDDFIDNLVNLGDWRSIYNAKHQRWVEWMEANDYDDRADLATVTALPQWKEVMGW